MQYNLDPRKEMILATVVEEYVQTAQPVGSKSVVKKGVRASSATVRNEMAELCEAGFLEQPHASSGRVPSDLGFRYYVDHLIDRRRLSPDDEDRLDLHRRSDWVGVDDLVSRTAMLLAELSRQVGVVMIAPGETAPLSAVYFRESGAGIRVLMQLADGSQEERLVRNERGYDAAALNRLSNLLNRLAPGRTLFELRRELLRQMEETKADLYLARAVELSEQVVAATMPEMVIRGQDHLFDLPEFAETWRIREMVRALEERSALARLLEQATMAGATRVIIGAENSVAGMKHCAVIARGCGRGGQKSGTLAVIGPTRLDYARLIPLVHHTSELVSECLRLG